VRRGAWARTRSEATSAARRSWRMNVKRLVIVGVGCGVVWWGLEMIDIVELWWVGERKLDVGESS
jgi:hypothetical protein